MADTALQPTNTPLLTVALDRMIADLIEVLSDEGALEFRPTRYAALRLWELLANVDSQMGTAFPYGYIYGDGDGGLRAEWKIPHREVRLRIAAQEGEQSYIYHQEHENYGGDKVVSAAALLRWLNWLIGR